MKGRERQGEEKQGESMRNRLRYTVWRESVRKRGGVGGCRKGLEDL